MTAPPYLLYLGDAPDELSIKTARGLASVAAGSVPRPVSRA